MAPEWTWAELSDLPKLQMFGVVLCTHRWEREVSFFELASQGSSARLPGFPSVSQMEQVFSVLWAPSPAACDPRRLQGPAPVNTGPLSLATSLLLLTSEFSPKLWKSAGITGKCQGVNTLGVNCPHLCKSRRQWITAQSPSSPVDSSRRHAAHFLEVPPLSNSRL